MKRIAVFGSTGSIGVQTLNVVRRFPSEFSVVALSGGNNIKLLEEQTAEFKPKYVAVQSLNANLPNTKVLTLNSGLKQLASEVDADIYVMAISGITALIPLIELAKTGKIIALANKEAVVCYEPFVKLCESHGTIILPVDSEIGRAHV